MNIEKLINDKLALDQESRKDRVRSGKISPSKLGRCYRLQYYSVKDVPVSNEIEDRTLRVFAVGNIFHKWIEDLMPEHQTEVKIESDKVLGYADIVTDDMVIDIKTQHSFAWHHMMKEGYDFNVKKKPDILQVTYYAIELKKPKASLVYVSKDDLCIYQRTFEIKHFEQEVVEELGQISHYVRKDELPPAQPRCYKDKNGKFKECAYCSWANVCKEDK